MDVWFIKNAVGNYYTGHRGEGEGNVFFQEGRKGAVMFRSQGAAEERISELGVEGCEAVEY